MAIVNVISLLKHCYLVFPELAYLPQIPPTHYVITCCLSNKSVPQCLVGHSLEISLYTQQVIGF